jgi:Fibronectin type III domain.
MISFHQVPLSDRATNYKIQIISSNSTRTETITHHSLNLARRNVEIDDLMGDVEYSVRIKAINRVGDGPWTEWIKTTTVLGKY